MTMKDRKTVDGRSEETSHSQENKRDKRKNYKIKKEEKEKRKYPIKR
jgi:hypothetical protein